MWSYEADVKLCHPVNIYVYRNGVYGVPPTLVHIDSDRKQNMASVLDSINERMKLPVGYPFKLYHTNGREVCSPSSLLMFHSYVVVTNLDKRFRPYRHPHLYPNFLVPGRNSKHISAIEVNERSFNIYNIRRRKLFDRRLQFGILYNNCSDGIGPGEIPYIKKKSKECGALCQKVKRECRNCEEVKDDQSQRPTTAETTNTFFPDPYALEYYQCADPCRNTGNFDASVPSEIGSCEIINAPQKNWSKSQHNSNWSKSQLNTNWSQSQQNNQDWSQLNPDNWPPPNIDGRGLNKGESEHLLAFINRYRDVGGQLYKMFQDRMKADPSFAQSKHDFQGGTEDDWLAEDLFKMFMERMDTKESVGKSSQGPSTNTMGVSQVSTAIASQSAKAFDLDKLTDSRTGGSTASTNVVPTNYRQESTMPKVSMSKLVHNTAPAGTSKPR